MMNKIIYLIVILSIVITTSSETVSMINGDHGFYQTVQDKCVKCHGDIKTQISTSSQHSSFSCTYCHIKSETNHTNTRPLCQDCHATPELNDPLEAHSGFASLGGDGCITCHTTYNAIINYSRAEYIDYDITLSGNEWIVSNFRTIGSQNISNNAKRNGGKHNIKEVSCKECHQDILDAVASGGHAVVKDKNGIEVDKHNQANYSTSKDWCLSCHGTNDPQFPTKQHASRKTTCDECHQAYGGDHPGNFYNNIKTVPHLYRSLVCIACKSAGWQAVNSTIHFTVRQEPYFDVAVS